LLLVFATPASAADPAVRKATPQRGGFVVIGNTLAQDCGAGVPAPLVGAVGSCGTNTADSAPDVFWSSDTPAAGQATADLTIAPSAARSTAVLALPSGAGISYARLYWSAQSSAAAAGTSVTIERPGTFSSTLSADASSTALDLGGATYYLSSVDVTALLQKQGVGAYRVGDIDSTMLANVDASATFVAWSLVVFYALDADPPRLLTLADGMALVTPTHTVTLALEGFLVPATAIAGQLAVVAYDGDNGVTGDSFSFDGTALFDALNPVDDFFNSTHSLDGAAVSAVGDLPQTNGMPGSLSSSLDLDSLDVSTLLTAGDTTAQVDIATTGDVVFAGILASSITTVTPLFDHAVKTDADKSATGDNDGDTIEYTIVVPNTGNDTGLDVVLDDPLPVGVSYVPGSLRITAGENVGPKTDLSGDDQGEYVATTRTIVVRLGAGANATDGGSMAVGDSTTVVFDVTIDANATGVIANQATLSTIGAMLQAAGNDNPITFVTGDGVHLGAATTFTIGLGGGTSCTPNNPQACASASAGSVCLPSGQCGCAHDSDCGGADSGRTCDPSSQACTDGCRGSGTGCPAGETCNAQGTQAGACVGAADDGGTGEGADAGMPELVGGGFGCSALPERTSPRSAPLVVVGLLVLFCVRRRARAITAALLLVAAPAAAQKSGFSLERYDPTPAGEWTLDVEHPWYSRTHAFFAGGLTLDYAHDPLIFGIRNASGFTQTEAVVAHALTGHVDLAASFFDRVLLSFSLPVVLLERGHSEDGVAPSGAAVGDPRLRLMVRVLGQPMSDAFSLHLGVAFGIPVGASHDDVGDRGVRVRGQVVMAGLKHHVMWSWSGGVEYRPISTLAATNAAIGTELQMGAAIAAADGKRGMSIGPELSFATVLTDGHAFQRSESTLELLVAAQMHIARQVQLAIGGGAGFLREAGTPDGRVIVRLAYAPMAKERPQVIAQPEDGDRDHDGVRDSRDLCPDTPMGNHPDPHRRGCPLGDRDGDAILDDEDVCPDTPAGPHPDLDRLGCPAEDFDHDGILDRDDACPRDPGPADPDPKKNGCPLATVKNGRVEISEQVFFATDRDVILERSFTVLTAVADVLGSHPEITKVLIEGHTDSQGSPAHNLDLSRRRAASVARWLSAHGVDAARLTTRGFGHTQPVASNATAVGRAQNRRVVFRIVSGDEQP
jgi:uncharacterized repeat protein (TIGR01451 family)